MKATVDDFPSDIEDGKKLVFDNLVRASFVVPGALVYSTRVNAYVSVKSRWYLARWQAKLWNEKLEWLETKKLWREYGTGNLWPDMMIHMTDDRPEDLKMLADYYRVARPDMVVEYMEEDDWYDAKRLETVMRHNYVLNPRMGSYVISRATVPPEAFHPLAPVPLAVPPPAEPEIDALPVDTSLPAEAETSAPVVAEPQPPPPPPMARPLSLAELPESVHVLNVGYDVSKLEPVLEALTQGLVLLKETKLKALESGQNPAL